MLKLIVLLAASISAAPTCSSSGFVQNAGFEKSTRNATGWYVGSGPFAGESSSSIFQPGYQSKNALLFTFKKGEAVAETYFTQKPCPGNYLYSFDYRWTVNGTADNKIQVNLGPSVTYVLPTQSTTWKKLSNFIYFEDFVGDIYSLRLRAFSKLGKNAHLLIDNIRFTPVNLTIKPNTPELLSNGGFETGSLAPWIVYGNATVVQPGLSGKYGLRINQTDLSAPYGLVQNVTLKVGGRYRLSMEYTYPFNTNDNSFLLLSYDLQGPNGSENGLGSQFARKGRTTFTRDFIATDKKAVVIMTFAYGLFEDTLWAPAIIDNISLKEIV